jgi:hypothetical protein
VERKKEERAEKSKEGKCKEVNKKRFKILRSKLKKRPRIYSEIEAESATDTARAESNHKMSPNSSSLQMEAAKSWSQFFCCPGRRSRTKCALELKEIVPAL